MVPTIIETGALNGKKDSISTLASKYEDYFACKETIDIKSYISHSRSDIGAFDYSHTPEFVRGGSYRCNFGRSVNGDLFLLNRSGSSRSRRGRSPNLDILEPLERARSATVTVSNIGRPKRSFDVPSRLSSIAMVDENSIPSRKDSGIRSNSRRSSLQIDNRLLSQERLQHRVSGYYTSSLSSTNSNQIPKIVNSSHGPFFDKYGTCIQNLRKQSDRQLIKCVQDNSKSQCSYFIKPPITQMSLFFKDKVMELDYRANVHRIHTNIEIDTLANSRFNTFLDIFVSIFVFLIVSITLTFIYGINAAWLITFLVCCMLQVLNLGICVIPIVRWTDKVCCCSRFYRWNFFGAILVSLPLFSVLVNFASDLNINQYELSMYTYPLFVGLLHFCNFTQLNSWMKSVIATIISVTWAILFLIKRCTGHIFEAAKPVNNITIEPPFVASDLYNSTNSSNITNYATEPNCYLNNLDMIVNLFLLLLLVWLLNREFEITYRLSFHTNYIANRDKSYVQKLKNQADYLIYNIVPEYVAEQLKREAKYSENFKDVAIIFASIVNFNEMYDESFEGGREYLRVLNELIGDFDELLYRKEYKCVEKIKTIGSTFMAASGLNSQMRSLQQDPNEHLYVLMDFAIEMQHVVENFNRDLLEFNLIIRIGYNFGDVTAAVIGNTKLYYDIWGDAVNIASRMDSTGVNGRIQVGEHCLPVLENKFNFEPRGSIYVKGKDNMNVYLVKDRKEDRNSGFLNVPSS